MVIKFIDVISNALKYCGIRHTVVNDSIEVESFTLKVLSNKQVAHVWSTDDIRCRAIVNIMANDGNLSLEQAERMVNTIYHEDKFFDLLLTIVANVDHEVGINWYVIDQYLETIKR